VGAKLMAAREVNAGESGYVNLASQERTVHILEGEPGPNGQWSGGHRWPGLPGKTPFPQSWSDARIMHEVSDVATDPKLEWVQQTGPKGLMYTKAGDPARFEVFGERGGVPIRVIVEPAGEGIITAHPIPGAP
jgi:Bacterial EndoU nuclease